MIKAIIFDFFGVIGQSFYALIHEDYKTNDQQNRQFRELHKALDYEFITQKEFLQAYADILHISVKEMQKLFDDRNRRFGPSKHLLEYIKTLRKKYKIGLLSNMTKESYLEFIEPIKGNFDAIITSYQAKLAKPERAIYELCAKQLGLDTSECLMVDDSYYNCEGARAAGMEAIEYTDLDNFKKGLAKFLADSDN